MKIKQSSQTYLGANYHSGSTSTEFKRGLKRFEFYISNHK